MERNTPWRYCVVGNIKKSLADDYGIFCAGSSPFTGGAEVYLCGKFWDPTSETIGTIGLNQFNIYRVNGIRLELIENVRCTKVYDPAVLYVMDNWRSGDSWWGNAEEDMDDAKRFVQQWNDLESRRKREVAKTKESYDMVVYERTDREEIEYFETREVKDGEKLLKVLQVGTGVKDIEDAIKVFSEFYTKKGIQIPSEWYIDDERLTYSKKCYHLLRILTHGSGGGSFAEVYARFINFYQSKGVVFPTDIGITQPETSTPIPQEEKHSNNVKVDKYKKEREKRKISDGAACLLVKDESLKQKWNAPIYKWLKEEGFISWGNKGTFLGVDWVFINLNSKVYAPGVPGVVIAPVLGKHAISLDEFKIIYQIYKKYEGLGTLNMSVAEQEEWDKVHMNIETEATDRLEKLMKEKNFRADQMTIEEYKNRIRASLLTIQKCSDEKADRLMKEYEKEFQLFYASNFTPSTVAGGIVSGLL